MRGSVGSGVGYAQLDWCGCQLCRMSVASANNTCCFVLILIAFHVMSGRFEKRLS